MATANSTLIKQAQAAIKAGQRPQAYQLLRRAIRQDKTDHVPWLILATIAPTPETAVKLVGQAAALKPDDPVVAKAQRWAQRRLAEKKTAVTSPPPPQPKQPPRREPQPAPTPIPIPTPAPAAAETAAVSNRRRWLRWGSLLLLALIVISSSAAYAWRQFNARPETPQPALAALSPTATADAGRLGQTSLSDQPATAPNPATTLTTVAPTPTTPPASPTPHPLQPKDVAPKDSSSNKNEARATWTLTPTPTNTPTPTPTAAPTFRAPLSGEPISRPQGVGRFDKWIRVNLATQTLTAYEGDLPVFETLISSGLARYPTVTGQFRVWLRYESQTMDGRRLGYDYYLENVPYVMYFYEDYALHGTFWHNNFGTPMSHGCVNMETNDAAWLFNWSTLGTVVYVHY